MTVSDGRPFTWPQMNSIASVSTRSHDLSVGHQSRRYWLPLSIYFRFVVLCIKLDIIYFPHFVLTGFLKNNEIHQYCTRNATKFYVISHRLACRSHSIKVLGVKLWNNLPNSITESLSLPVFKCRCKHYLINND